MIIKDPIRFRNNITHELDKIITDKKISLNMEKAVFNYCINECKKKKIIKKWQNPQFVLVYIDHLRTVFNNIKQEEILKKLKNHSVTPHIISFMTHQELKPSRWQKLILKKNFYQLQNLFLFVLHYCKYHNLDH